MSEKIIRRVANKYRQCMMREAARPIEMNRAIYQLDCIDRKSKEVHLWLRRFQAGTEQRVRYSDYDSRVDKGIVCKKPYEDIMAHMVPDLMLDMSNSMEYLKSYIKNLADPNHNKIVPLSLKEAINEIRVIFNAWPNVKYRNNILSVLIKKVVLEDDFREVDLGDFYIEINPSNPLQSLHIKSESQICSEAGYCHPHVSSGTLCTGDGESALQDAISQGRLEDFFRVVEAILRTYNDASPHEALTEWYDPQHENQFYCERCEEWRPDEESSYCENCQENYCERCNEDAGQCIVCEEWSCENCKRFCMSCDETVCENCSSKCSECQEGMCQNCSSMCVTCEKDNCSECSEHCTYCGDITCRTCRKECPCCTNIYCESCLDEECNECSQTICSGCQTTCDSCEKLICTACEDNECEDCGCSMCLSCENEHKCLLSETNSGK